MHDTLKTGKIGKKETRGIVFDIQRYSIHDGPGLRTTIFLKGCPLRCKWCSNPESQNPYPELFIRKDKCNRCMRCVGVCHVGAITLDEDLRVDRSRCDFCMKCVDVCPTGAIKSTGEYMSVEQVIEEASKDEIFYRNSGGGITISGGEPLYQGEFTLELLKMCKEKNFHTALDTCGYGRWEIFAEILEYTDLVLFDVKHLDSEMDRKMTGVGNELILKNLERIGEKGKSMWIRVPVIPGYNDSEEYIKEFADFLSKVHFEKVSLLPYHNWAEEKYRALSMHYPLNGLLPLKEEDVYSLRDILETYGMDVTIGY